MDFRATRKHKEKLAKSYARTQRHEQQLEYLEEALQAMEHPTEETREQLPQSVTFIAQRLPRSPKNMIV